MVQRDRSDFEQCSRPPSDTCIVDSPFSRADDSGNLTIRVIGSNKVSQEFVDFPLHLRDRGLQLIILIF